VLNEIMKQNSCILEFGMKNKCKWEYFTEDWIYNNFGQELKINNIFSDILITLI
jgi:hypothetical protein